MTGIALGRLKEERKSWRKDHPPGFYARPMSKGDGSADLLRWECGIPGKEKTDWEGGLYKVILKFSSEYPASPPVCAFSPPIFHPNVYTCGQICLDIIGQNWKPSITLKDILVGIQQLLDTPNKLSPANGAANQMFTKKNAEYRKRIRMEAKRFAKENQPM